MNYEIAAEGFEPLTVDDMGEGVLVLSQLNEGDKVERIAVSIAQIAGAMDAAALRYGQVKNTDRAARQAA